MKASITFIMLLVVASVFSQDPIAEQIKVLKKNIARSNQGEKLFFMDSLCNLTRYNRTYSYDSIAKATIAYAYELDSTDMVIEHTSNLIYYYTNRFGSPEEGQRIFDAFERKQMNTQNYDLLARLYSNGADSYFYSNQLKASLLFYDKAEQFALKAKDSSLFAYIRSYKAAAYSDDGDYVTASKLLRETVDYFTRHNDTVGLFNSRGSLATIYSKVGFYDEAAKERNEVIRIARDQNYIYSLVPNLINAAIDAGKQGNYSNKVKYLLEASRINNTDPKQDKNNPQYALIVLYELLATYAKIGDLEKAKAIYTDIQERHKTVQPTAYFESVYIASKTDYLLAQKKYSEALNSAKQLETIRLEMANQEGIYNAYGLLHECYKGLGNFKMAHDYYHKFVSYRDSVNSVQKAKALAYYQTLYETEKRDFKIASQAAQIAILDHENRTKQQFIFFGGIGLLLLMIIFYFWRVQYYAKRKQKLQREFSQGLIKGQEEERLRIARELHDGVGQKLVLLKKKSSCKGQQDMEHLAGNTLDELRTILTALHPEVLERLGITKALYALIHEVDDHSDIFFTADIEDIDNVLTQQNELHLYRIVQEALNNIVKHSKAKSVTISVKKKFQGIKTIIKDNGRGFTITEKLRKGGSLGMKTLVERAKIMESNLYISAEPDKGTSINLTIPK